jgi:hypothetical protein|tara:strand:- start:303 stop:1067 length:765 start_codon:yes stop_codon:yes gene_type:complete
VKTRTINKKQHILFENEEEFNKYMPKTPIITDWRKGNEGDWVLCDDGQICQVLKKGKMKLSNRNVYNSYIRTVIGSFVCKQGGVTMEGDMRKNIYSFGAHDKTPYQTIKQRKKPTKKEFLFAKYVAKGDEVVDAFMKAYPAKSRDYAKRESSLLMSTKRIQGLIREEIEKVMNEAEITPLYILEKMKDIIESTTSRDSDKVSLLKELVAIAGMRDTDKKSESVTVFQGFSPQQLEAIGGGNTKKLASAKRKLKS